MSRRGVVLGILGLVLSVVLPPLARPESDDVQARFERLKRERRQVLDDLAVPIAQCVRKRDTNHIAFHGCIDWHSSVHGTWALVKYTGLTGDTRYAPLIHEILKPEKVNAELQFLQQNPTFEMPYGRAWFLRLALDYKAVFRSELLTPMGDFVARSLMDHYRSVPPQPESPEYENPSWALINLYDYGVSRNEAATVEFVRDMVRKHFLAVTQPCPVQKEETQWQEFLPVCTTWAYLVAYVSPPDDLPGWLNRFFPQDVSMSPISRPVDTLRHKAMNFSRSWGFWRLFKATKDPRYLKLYVDHFELQYRNQSWWKGDYRAVGHWVAQFGVFALAPVFAE